ncbi:hypothetical protein RI367_002259 [Sorochytrium milnesiophthora]
MPLADGDIAARLASLPPEVVVQIVARGGVRVCAILRHSIALRVILCAHAKLNDRYLPEDEAAVRQCVVHRWYTGVRLLTEEGGSNALMTCTFPDGSLDDIVVPARVIRSLLQRTAVTNLSNLACLVYNLRCNAAQLVGWIRTGYQTYLDAFRDQVVRRGGTMEDLRRLCDLTGNSKDDGSLMRLFVQPAARWHRIDVLCQLPLSDPAVGIHLRGVLQEAARPGGLRTVQYLCARVSFTEDEVAAAAGQAQLAGAFDVASWLAGSDETDISPIQPAAAARMGRLDILAQQLSRDASTFAYDLVAAEAAYHGHTGVLDWLCGTEAVRFDSLKHLALIRAASGGHLSTVQWVAHKLPIDDAAPAVMAALTRGHIHVAEWLLAHIPCQMHDLVTTRETLIDIIKTGRVEALRLLERDRPLSYTVAHLTTAIETGNLDLVRHIHRTLPHTTLTPAMVGLANKFPSVALAKWAVANAT